MCSLRVSPSSTNKNFCVHTCSLLTQSRFQKSSCNLLRLSQTFYKLCSILCAGIESNFVVREININVFILISGVAPQIYTPPYMVTCGRATAGQFPHHALIVGSSSVCSGSLISPTWVLTTAGCAWGSVWTVMWQGPFSFILKSRFSNSTQY
jgi:hypothetical protein